VFEGLTDLEEAIVHSAVQASLRDTTIVGSSVVTTDETPSTDALIDRATEFQTLPRFSLAR